MTRAPEPDWDVLAGELAGRGLTVMRDHDLGASTTYGVGGPARLVVRARNEADIEAVAAIMARHRGVPTLVVGRGSNLLVCDEGFAGVAVLWSATGATDEVGVDGETVAAGAMVPMPVLARRAAALGRGGLEWAVGVPGTVGGAVRMNAGCHGSDMCAALVDADVVSLVSGRRVRVVPGDLGLHFRGSALADHHVVVAARMRTHPCDPAESAEEMARIVAWRRENQPGGRNAGSVFVNPGDGAVAAGSLVDGCGLKGLRHGGAEVSPKHANFIQVHEGATASDVVAVMTHVQTEVEAAHGVRLRSEIRLVGFDDEVSRRFSDERHHRPEAAAAAARIRSLLGEDGA